MLQTCDGFWGDARLVSMFSPGALGRRKPRGVFHGGKGRDNYGIFHSWHDLTCFVDLCSSSSYSDFFGDKNSPLQLGGGIATRDIWIDIPLWSHHVTGSWTSNRKEWYSSHWYAQGVLKKWNSPKETWLWFKMIGIRIRIFCDHLICLVFLRHLNFEP